jgi:prevent-host-death family protein
MVTGQMTETKPNLARTIMASRFKAECLAILDQVDQMKISVTITKHGRPVARVVPLDDDPVARPTLGSVRLIAEADEAYFSTGERWETGQEPR